MATHAAAPQRVRVAEHYERAAQDLVEAHTKLKRSPLVLAVRYHFDHDLDIYLLEVIEDFPGQDDDPPFTTEFAPNERMVILGKLHLTLVSPAQLEHALHRSGGKRSVRARPADVIAGARKDGRVLFEARSPPRRARMARAMKDLLGLS